MMFVLKKYVDSIICDVEKENETAEDDNYCGRYDSIWIGSVQGHGQLADIGKRSTWDPWVIFDKENTKQL
jgi:hypothetical protein